MPVTYRSRFLRRASLFWVVTLIGSAFTQTAIDTRIPSTVAGDTGIFTRISLPLNPRYGAKGSPVVIHVPGGFGSGGVGPSNAILRLPDCFQLQFNFPGGGYNEQKSGGTFDERGPNCLMALRDVIRFALGAATDQNGKLFSQLAGPIKPMAANVGLVGFSNGGNATIAAAGMYGAHISGLAWIVNWESPVGDGMANAECGADEGSGHGLQTNPEVNPAYHPDTGEFDLTTLAYCDTLHLNPARPAAGGLYFDIHRNGVIDWGADFVLRPHDLQIGGKWTVYYSNRVIGAARSMHLLPSPLPAHIADTSATRQFWSSRDGETWIAAAVQHNPQLMFLVEASEDDHVQSAPDHPHVLIQYEGFRRAGARFVRLNPDRAYVEAELGRSAPNASDNDAFRAFDHLSIRSALEPAGENGIATSVGQVAAIYELADRTYYNDVSPQLASVLTRVSVPEDAAPAEFRLDQNYPNPFNPQTTIGFSIATPGDVTLKVYDLTGRQVATLVQGHLSAGAHSAMLVLHGGASGVYFYQLTAGSFSRTRRALFIQ
ncbi:MAG TPA: T9SS type A sorting domain-containing protein [bacterium]|nr:T9SS type A sorting domain-containing protein [bacterium]